MDLQRYGAFAPPARRVAAAAPAPPIQTSVTEGTRVLVSLTSEVAAVLFLVYLMLASGGSIRRHVARACGVTPQLSRAIQEVFGLIERQMRQYLGLLLITNAILGVSLWAAFSLLGVAHAAMWGGAAALLHFVPYVGPAVIAIGSGLLASVQFDSLARGVLVGATTVALSTTIGVALTTWLAGRTARMNTIAIFVSLLFWSWLWSLPGLVLGTPITMGLKVVCNKWQRLRWLDALLEGHPRRPLVQRVVLRPISPVPGAAAHK
jgi:predicted PurR-regulated permease PerM